MKAQLLKDSHVKVYLKNTALIWRNAFLKICIIVNSLFKKQFLNLEVKQQNIPRSTESEPGHHLQKEKQARAEIFFELEEICMRTWTLRHVIS